MKIIAIGKTAAIWQSAEKEFLQRLSGFTKIELLVLTGEKAQEKEKIIWEEGKKILAKISTKDFVVVLNKEGESLSSEKLAQKINFWQTNGKNLVFIIGGAFGLSEAIIKRADFVLSLSNLTFTHEIARIILLEQLYRSFMILNNKPYHY